MMLVSKYWLCIDCITLTLDWQVLMSSLNLCFFCQVGEDVYHVTGEVEVEGGASFLHCSVNGVKSRPKLVILDSVVHLFSTVGLKCILETSSSFFWNTNTFTWLSHSSKYSHVRLEPQNIWHFSLKNGWNLSKPSTLHIRTGSDLWACV